MHSVMLEPGGMNETDVRPRFTGCHIILRLDVFLAFLNLVLRRGYNLRQGIESVFGRQPPTGTDQRLLHTNVLSTKFVKRGITAMLWVDLLRILCISLHFHHDTRR